MLAGVDVEEKVGEGAFEARSPAFVNGKACSCDFRGYREIEDSGSFADFPVGLWRKIEFRSPTPAADFYVVGCACTHGHGRMRNIGDSEEKFALRGVEFGYALIGLLDALRNLLHFSDDGVGVFLLLLEASDFIAGLVALCFELLRCSDEFAALLVEFAKGIKVERAAALLRHIGEDVQVISEIVQVMHGVGRIP